MGLARDDARAGKIDAALGRPLDEMRRVGRREHRRIWPEQPDRGDEPLGPAIRIGTAESSLTLPPSDGCVTGSFQISAHERNSTGRPASSRIGETVSDT